MLGLSARPVSADFAQVNLGLGPIESQERPNQLVKRSPLAVPGSRALRREQLVHLRPSQGQQDRLGLLLRPGLVMLEQLRSPKVTQPGQPVAAAETR